MKLKVALGTLVACLLLLGLGLWSLGLQHWVLGVRSSAGSVDPHISYPAFQRVRPAGSIHSAGLVLHGLNLDPGKMAPLSNVLAERGILVLQGALQGHRVSTDEYLTASRAGWLQEAQTLFQAGKSEQSVGPFVCLGFSLGALLILDAQAQGLIACDKMILFAPAVVTKVPAWLIQMAKNILPQMMTLPTAVPLEYRRHDRFIAKPNFLAAESMQALGQADPTKLNVPTVVFISPKDEVVSFPGVLDWIGQRNLTNWRLETVLVNPDPSRRVIHHLIIDEPSVGTAEWKRILYVMDRFLN